MDCGKRFRLDGVADQAWREDLSDASFAIRFFDAKGDRINQRAFRILGQTAWLEWRFAEAGLCPPQGKRS